MACQPESTETLEITRDQIDSLIALLNMSTRHVPDECRAVGSWRIGYLPFKDIEMHLFE